MQDTDQQHTDRLGQIEKLLRVRVGEDRLRTAKVFLATPAQPSVPSRSRIRRPCAAATGSEST